MSDFEQYGDDNDYDFDYDPDADDDGDISKEIAEAKEEELKQLIADVKSLPEKSHISTIESLVHDYDELKGEYTGVLSETRLKLLKMLKAIPTRRARTLLEKLGQRGEESQWRKEYQADWDKLFKKHMAPLGFRGLTRELRQKADTLLKQNIERKFATVQKDYMDIKRAPRVKKISDKFITKSRASVCLLSQCENAEPEDPTKVTISLMVTDKDGVKHCQCYRLRTLLAHIEKHGYVDPVYRHRFSSVQIRKIQTFAENSCLDGNKILIGDPQSLRVTRENQLLAVLPARLMEVVTTAMFEEDGDTQSIGIEVSNGDLLSYSLIDFDRVAPPGTVVLPSRVGHMVRAPNGTPVSIQLIKMPYVTEISVTSLTPITERELEEAVEQHTIFYKGQILVVNSPSAHGRIPVRVEALKPLCGAARMGQDVRIPLTINVSRHDQELNDLVASVRGHAGAGEVPPGGEPPGGVPPP
jgi:hypothetical protein